MILTRPLADDIVIHPTVLRFWDNSQHPARKREYSLALYARELHDPTAIMSALDIGGFGSPFHLMVDAEVVDPAGGDYAASLHSFTLEGFHPFDQVFCISVIEHVDDLEEFVCDLAQIVAPGGLLFLTMDAWNEPPERPDTAHFYWMRKRIFTKESWDRLAANFGDLGFILFGEADWDSLIPEIEPGWGYGFVSLCMRKR